jgi:DNA-directed RNA polymerase specialized sigma24 family protein
VPSTIEGDFEARIGVYRHELLVHCYRLLGSVQETEDQVRETMLRAWRARERYDEDLASVRTCLVLTVTRGGVARDVVFQDSGAFTAFGPAAALA